VAGFAGLSYFLTSNGTRPVIGAASTNTPQVIRPTQQRTPAAATQAGTELPAATDTPGTPAPLSGDTLEILKEATVPPRDPFDLAVRLEGKEGISPTLPPSEPFQVGDQQPFWASNGDTHENFQVQATLRYVTEHGYFWIENGVPYDPNQLKDLAETFERQMYPRDREFFGSEWTPGVDGDPHLYILYARNLGSGVAGYFSSLDSFPPSLVQFSNGHEMFLFNADVVDFSEQFTYGVLAHEFQHMIHWYRDRDETRWLNEGFSDLAMFINGYDIGGHDYVYAMNPDLQLNDWPTDEADAVPNYGAAFLFLNYFLDRFGEDATKALVGIQANGLESIDELFAQMGTVDPESGQPVSADSFFMDWAVTNYLHDASAGDGRYVYKDYPTAPQMAETENLNSCPTGPEVRDVHQYGVDYIRIDCRGDYTLSFEGSVQADLVPADPHSGSYAFWSNKGDEADITLTQTFDFKNRSGPISLSYWTWYDLEKEFDFLYLLASTDGEHWQMLRTPSGTDRDITGSNYGWGYNGKSGGGDQAEWVQEEVDLSQFAGQEVQLRFEYITDAGVNGEGFLLDDVAIPEIGYASDFESDDGGWEPAGFVRVQNVLPQTFQLALITRGDETRVQNIPLSPDASAQVPLHIGAGVNDAVLVVTGTTRFTRQPAAYRFSIEP
jgi:hypothetical protein